MQRWSGKKIEVAGAATHFGPMSFRIESGADGKGMWVAIDPPRRTPPRRITVRLRHPSCRPIAAVEADDKRDVAFEKDVIELEQVRKPIRLDVRFK